MIRPGSTLVEGPAGNTGLGLALVAAQKGYRLVLVIPDKMSREKISNLKAMGAEVVLTRSDVAKGHPEYYQDLARRLAAEMDDAFFINQFGNPSNPMAHEEVTGPEIWTPDGGRTGRHRAGRGFQRYGHRPVPLLSPGRRRGLELVLADPEGSILAEYINEGTLCGQSSGSWLVEGIGEDFLPTISDFSRISKAYAHQRPERVSDRSGIADQGRDPGRLIHRHTGGAALAVLPGTGRTKRVLTFACDTGNRYLSKMFNDFWMRDQGFIEGRATTVTCVT